MRRKIQLCKGYTALVTVLVVSAVVLSIVISVSFTAIFEGQISLTSMRNMKALNITEICVEDSLIRINESAVLPESITLEEGSCSITIEEQMDGYYKYLVDGVYDEYSKSIRIEALRSNKVYLISQVEVN